MAPFTAVPTICVALIALLLAIIGKRKRETLSRWISPRFTSLPRGLQASNSKTPPRSFSPQKKVPNNAPQPVEYQDIFPPSPRDALPQVADKYPEAQKSKLSHGPLNEEHFRKNIIPFTVDYRECASSTYTPMGFSVDEIKALGDFPDYASLSGVPLPEYYQNFKIETACARPYRPFRWAYHQTMSLAKLENDWWLELESSYTSRIAERKNLFAQYGKMVLAYLPGSELACKEITEMALQFLCARHPQYFSLSEDTERGYVFHNGILNNETVINSMHPLHVLLENVPEDFACMLRNPEDGCYYFRAGIICSSLGWNVDTKIGLQLKEIHAPIPDYKEKMEFSMDRYFSKLPSSRPIQRGSWGLEVDTPLFMPPNDPHEAYRLSHPLCHFKTTLTRIHLRVDWQTLRRLPLSGSIVFNFKALFTPITDFRHEPYIPALVVKILKEGKKSMMEYKNTWHIEHVALPALEQWKEEQEEEGLVEAGWTEETLMESPFFRGWEEKWMSARGS